MNLGNAIPQEYQLQLDKKTAKTIEEFSHFAPPKLEVFDSPKENFRMRAEFKIWHQNGKAHYAMYRPGEYKKPVLIESFSIGSSRIVELMPKLLKAINNSPLLKVKLFQVEFLTSTTGDSITTLIYHKPLQEDWKNEALALAKQLDTRIIGRSRKQKLCTDTDFIIEHFEINGSNYEYKQIESAFTQPNAFVCQKMLQWTQNVSKNLSGDLLELYCGNGNFTIPLSKNFERVLATEVSKTSVNAAHDNIQRNGITNIQVVRMSSEEFTQALNKVRPFRRLKDINLEKYNFSTILVDPPRAGLDEDTLKLASGFDNVLYISCNPNTLRHNLENLIQTHSVKEFALFDQFPYTEHRECGLLLQKNRVK